MPPARAINGEYVLNPSPAELAQSKMDLVVAGTETAVLMVESEADQLSEDIMLGAVVFGHEQMALGHPGHPSELVRDAGKAEWQWTACQDEDFIAKVNNLAEGSLRAAYQIRSSRLVPNLS